MPETCSHPKGALVVPEKVIPAFQGSLIPRSDTVVETKKTIPGLLKTAMHKSTGIAGPVALFGSVIGFGAFTQIEPNPDPLTLVVTTFSLLFGIMGGSMGTMLGLNSVVNGDREYFPLPTSKKYRQLQEDKRQNVIAPFAEWDSIFDKNDDRMQKMSTPGN